MDVKKMILCSALAFTSSYADTPSKQQVKEEKKQQEHAKEKKYIEGKITNLANAYFPELKNPVNIWFDVGLLYFVPKIRSMDYTTGSSDVLTTSNFTKKPLVNSNFQWQPGFQVGVGYVMPKIRWDVALKGYHYHSATSGHRDTEGNNLLGMFPLWSLSDQTLPGDYVTSAIIKGKLTFDRILLQGGYFFPVTDRFVIRTAVGLENVFLKQGYHIEYAGGIYSSGIDYIHMDNNFWGIGPQVGVYPWVGLGEGFSFSGRAAASFLCGRFSIEQNETYLGNQLYDSSSTTVRGRWSTDVEAGVQWKHLFFHDQFSFAVRLAYEYLVYFDQNQLEKDAYNKLHGGAVQIQGGILSVLFDF